MKRLVIGVGNVLMQDDGIGPFCVEELRRSEGIHGDLLLIDGGTMGLDLMPYFEDVQKCVIIDALALPKPPGTIEVIESNDIKTVLGCKMSVHEIGLTDLLEALEFLERLPGSLTLVGMVPFCVEFSYGLSEEARKRLPDLVQRVKEIMQTNMVHSRIFGPIAIQG